MATTNGIIYSKLQVNSAEYDFDKDPDNGTAGILDLGAKFPKNCSVFLISIIPVVPLTGGAGAEVSFGFRSLQSATASSTRFLSSTAIATVNAGIFAQVTTVPYRATEAFQLIMGKNVDDLTDGRLQITLWYVEYNF